MWSKLLNHTKNRTHGHILSNNDLCTDNCIVCVTSFSIGGKSNWFQMLQSYTLLLKPPTFTHSCSQGCLGIVTLVSLHVRILQVTQNLAGAWLVYLVMGRCGSLINAACEMVHSWRHNIIALCGWSPSVAK